MRVLLSLLAMLLLFVAVGNAQEKDAPPGESPHLWQASAWEQEGKVVVQIAEPHERGGTAGRGGFEPGVGTLPSKTVMKWSNFPKVVLGKSVHAFRASGLRAEPKSVLQSLAKPKCVAVFLRTQESDPTKPDPFYLAPLRDDAIVLIVDQKDIYPQEP